MLASRRQSLQLPFDTPAYLDLDTEHFASHFDALAHIIASPSPSDFAGRPNYFTPSPEFARPPAPSATGADEHMSNTFAFASASPAIRVQQSTPAPHLPFAAYPAQTVLGDEQHGSNGWLDLGGNGSMMANAALQHNPVLSARSRHQRVPSSSSAGSNSPASPYSQGHAPQLRYGSSLHSLTSMPKPESSSRADEASRNFPNNLPTPTQTPTQDSFVASSQPSLSTSHFQNLDSAMAAHMAMKQVFGDGGSVAGEDAPGFSHSARQSVSSFGRNSPATPRTIAGDDFNTEDFKVPSNGESTSSKQKVEDWMDLYLRFDDDPDAVVRPQAAVPKFDRTMTDVFADELYNPTSQRVTAPPQRSLKANTLLSPYHNSMMSERLQQANQARSLSPSVNNSPRGLSPFREGSRYAPMASQGHAQIHQRAVGQQQSGESEQPKTISPKDALLEYHESDDDTKMPLFPEGDGAFDSFVQNNSSRGKFTSAADGSFGSLGVGGAVNAVSGWPGQNSASYSQAQATTSTAPSAPAHSTFNFAPAAVPGMFHGLPNTSTPFAPTSMPAMSPDDTPEFPAHLTSMESSASEAPPQSSNTSTGYAESSARPSSTLADTGTYTCTYHGCTQRFETPQKLQRHKREAHRQNNAASGVHASMHITPGIGSGMTSAALLARNSQAGPHKCERINPTTGKPCNTIFSRPYDLTRHEDTIHNVRKQKVRCALCQEEKTFSRNDALTRHMRVVHPDVDFPGKHRRRGGRGDD